MNVEELKTVVEKSNVILKKLKMKYPNLDGYLVLSSPNGQCRLTDDMVEILNLFPQMIVDCRHKQKGLQLLQKIDHIESENKRKTGYPRSFDTYRIQLSDVVKRLSVKEDTFVEIRFKKSDLDLIVELQKDELISQEHTPQTKASIRIVLGTVGELYLKD